MACVILLLFMARTPPLQATQPHTARPAPDARNYVNAYLVNALNLRDISPIVIDYMSPEDEYFIHLLDLMIRLKYHAHAKQMIGKAGKETALLRSAAAGCLACVKYLHEEGADIKAKNNWGNTALVLSARQGDLACVKYLHEAGADVKYKNKWGNTALIWSAVYGHLACVKYLHEQGADIDTQNKNRKTALMGSAYRGHLACIKYLCQQGADINAKNKWGNTALICSAVHGHFACVKYLIGQGADTTLQGEGHKTALAWAIELRREDVVDYLSNRTHQD